MKEDTLLLRAHVSAGDDGFRQYNDYGSSSSARMTADSLAGKLYYTNSPLTLTQAEGLVRIIKSNTQKGAVQGLIGDSVETDWNAVLEQARGVLSPQQLSTLQALEEKQRLARQSSELSQKLLQEAAVAAAKNG